MTYTYRNKSIREVAKEFDLSYNWIIANLLNYDDVKSTIKAALVKKYSKKYPADRAENLAIGFLDEVEKFARG